MFIKYCELFSPLESMNPSVFYLIYDYATNEVRFFIFDNLSKFCRIWMIFMISVRYIWGYV